MSSRPCRSASLASICCPVLLISNVLLLHLLGRKSCDAESLSTLDVPVGILPRTDCRGFKYPPSALVVPTPGLLLSFLCSFSRAAGGRVRVAGIALIGSARLPSWSTGTSRLSSNYFVFQCCLSYQGRWAYAIEDGSFLSGARAALTYPSFWYVVRCSCPLCCLISSIYRFVFARGVAISYTSRHTAPCPCPNRRASTHEPRMCSPCYRVL